ncbi:unnamed protein product, partial [marine sediment metagenome]
ANNVIDVTTGDTGNYGVHLSVDNSANNVIKNVVITGNKIETDAGNHVVQNIVGSGVIQNILDASNLKVT